MIRLVLPSHYLRNSWFASMREFEGATLHGYSTFRFDYQDLSDDAVFDAWLNREQRLRVSGEDGLVAGTCWWIVDDEDATTVLGSIHLRHTLNARLLADGGHVGYGIRPTARGRGIATAALALCLDEARALGLQRLLLVCDADNPASRRTIISAGGVLENAPGSIERYWVALGR